ncbi:MAG: metal ABC transporter solute-binding protein, Zn/Mn family, partial [Amnibacterium sp.]
MRVGRGLPGLLVLATSAALLLAGCSATSAPPAGSGRIAVVASTDVWGSVVTGVGAGRVDVTSIIDDPSRDPHDYEADVRDRLHVLRAAIVVENGGGYDDFMTRLRDGAPGRVIDAVRLSGFDTTAPGFNEHVSYDLPTVRKVADAVSAALQRVDPVHAGAYRAALARFEGRVDDLAGREAAIRRVAQG